LRARDHSAKDGADARIGDAVTLKATLQPPPEPVEPGGFDFGRQAWFASLGATGYATSKIEALKEARAPPWDLAVWASVDALRARVNARIRAALSGETGEIAVALITGERGGISEELNQAMRDSGLAHILSISGLHMVIMGLSDVSLVWATLRKGWGLVMGAAVTTLVASAAIAPFAVYHFHRMTHYGLVANMIAAPLVSLLIMPMAVLSLIAMPFGLEVAAESHGLRHRADGQSRRLGGGVAGRGDGAPRECDQDRLRPQATTIAMSPARMPKTTPGPSTATPRSNGHSPVGSSCPGVVPDIHELPLEHQRRGWPGQAGP
jgi:predicted membrane metal-binding protein